MGISGSLCHRERSVAISKIKFFLRDRHVASRLTITFSVGNFRTKQKIWPEERRKGLRRPDL